MIEERPEGIILRVKVSANASKTEAAGVWRGPDGPRLKLRVQAPPVEGKANEAIIKWGAKTFALASNRVAIIQGEKNSAKAILLEGLRRVEAEESLEKLMGMKS